MAGIGPIEMLIVLMLGGGLGMPLGLPPLPEDPALAQVAPAECLFYSNWSGTAAADPNSANRTERLLAEPEVQELSRALDQAIVASIRTSAGATGPRIEEAFELVKLILSRPTALYVTRFTPPAEGSAFELEAGLIVNTGESRQKVEQSLNNLLRSAGLNRADENVVEIEGVRFQTLPVPHPVPQVLWGFHETHFLLAIGRPVAEQMAAGLKQGRAPPAWLAQLRRDLPVERIASVSYYDLAKARGLLTHFAGPRSERMLDALGLANAQSFATVTGLDGEGVVARSRIQIAGQAKGVLAFAQARPLARGDLAPIPRDATLAMAMRLDPATVVEQIGPLLNEIDPALRRDLEKQLQPEALGFDVPRLARSLGDVWCLYSSPGEGGLVATGLTLVVPIRDRAGVAQALDGVAAAIRNAFPPADKDDAQPGQQRQPVLRELTFRGQELWTLDVAAAGVPIGPTWCLSDRELIVTLYPQTLKAYLARAAGGETLADVPEVAQALAAGSGPVSITYQDTRTLFRTLYPLVQTFAPLAMAEARRGGFQLDASMLPSAASIDKHLAPGVSTMRSVEGGIVLESRQVLPWGGAQFSSLTPVAAVALVPAVGAARESARRAQASNNLKQIGLAMHNYHDVNQHLPAPANYDKQGKPLLSWRVHVLPYLEQNQLYEQFHLDEPWDSEHNRKLIPQMPVTYKSPTGVTIEPGKTAYLLPRGKGTMFERTRGPTFADIPDGTSNTIMTVEASADRAVVWTRPDDYSYDPEQPLAGLSGLHKGIFLAGFADGSVQAISDKVDVKMLKALFTRQGGEAVRRP